MSRLPFSLALALSAGRLLAADFVPSHYLDSIPSDCLPGDCSLREALLAANESPGPDRIVLSAGFYTLTRFGLDDDAGAGDLDVTEDLEIVGPAVTMTRIDADGFGPNYDEPVITVHAGTALTLRGLTLAMGKQDGIDVSGTLIVERCEIRENSFNGSGAGIVASDSAASIVVRDSAIVNNGRGIQMAGGELAVANTTFTSNNAFQISLTNVTLASCRHCTLADLLDGNPEIRLDGTTLELEASLVDGDCQLINGGEVSSLGGNLESPGDSCGLVAHVDSIAVGDPGLSTLGDHGGPTRTFDLAVDSAAVARVDASQCDGVDQRGVGRGEGFFDCDAGAVERTATAPPTPIFHDGFEQGNDNAWSFADV